jgi:succinate dehydrogenase/fumarate reductase iron-sulfur protein
MRTSLKIRSDENWIEKTVEAPEGATLLDALEMIRTGGEPGLRYRHSCHHGSCGTCGALVNGKPRLLCLSSLAEFGFGPVILEPLAKQESIGDLAVLPSPLFRSLPEGATYLRPSEAAPEAVLPHDGAPEEDGGTREAAASSLLADTPNGKGDGAVRFESCIECGLCVEACPVRGDFLGPAALALADREIEKRPNGGQGFLEFASGPDGAAACERRFECSRACPQGVAPGRHIQGLRRRME